MKLVLKFSFSMFVYLQLVLGGISIPSVSYADVTTYCMWGYAGTSPSATPVVVSNSIYDSTAVFDGNVLEVLSEVILPSPASALDYFPLSSTGGSQGHVAPASLNVTWLIQAVGTIGILLPGEGLEPAYYSSCSDSFIFSRPEPSITISPTSVVIGDEVTITWNTVFNTAYNYPVCSFDGSPIAPGGTHKFIAATSDSRSYEFSCSNLFGSLAASAALTVNTPSCSDASIHTGIINTMSSWSPVPYERSFLLRCTGTNTVTPLAFNDSFHLVWSGASRTNDPCRVDVGWIPNYNLVGASHSHPLFTSAAQYNEGVGCHGAKDPSITTTDLSNLNALNEFFSSPGDSSYPAGRVPLYLLTPYADKIKKLTCSTVTACTTQIYP